MSAQKGRMGPTKVGDLFPFTTLAKHGLARTSWHERSSSIQTLLCIQCRSFTMSDTPSLKRTRKVSPSLHDIQSSSEQAESPAHTAGFPEMLSTNSTKGLIAFLLYNHDVRQLVLDCLNVYDFAMLATTNSRVWSTLFKEHFDISESETVRRQSHGLSVSPS